MKKYFVVYCENCGEELGYYKKKVGYGYRVREGTISTGQGLKKPLLHFCNKKCVKEWQKKNKKKLM